MSDPTAGGSCNADCQALLITVSTPGIAYGTPAYGSFNCGGAQCGYTMTPYQINFLGQPLRGATLQVHVPGPGNGRWTQTYSRDGSQPAQDCSSGCPFYTGPYTNGSQFYDQAGVYNSGTFSALTSYVQGNNVLFTFGWGFQTSASGTILFTPQAVPNGVQVPAIGGSEQ